MRRALFQIGLVVFLAVMATAGLDAAELTGRMVGITDGNTFTLLTPQRARVVTYFRYASFQETKGYGKRETRSRGPS